MALWPCPVCIAIQAKDNDEQVRDNDVQHLLIVEASDAPYGTRPTICAVSTEVMLVRHASERTLTRKSEPNQIKIKSNQRRAN